MQPEEPLGLAPPRRRRWIVVASIIAAVVIAVVGFFVWYNLAKRPVDPSAMTKTTVIVEQGMSPIQIGELLQNNGLIRSTLAYRMYIKLQDIEGKLQAGTYKIAASEDLPAVVDHLTNGKTSTFTITFYPGATLFNPTGIDDEKRTDVYTMLRRAGFSDRTVRAALADTYDSPLFEGKPKDANLEGYVYGETYQFATTATANEILEHTFSVYYQALKDNGIISGIKKQKLTLYQAITLASIVQREVTDYQDMRKVAQVFYSRLEKGMPLGSDVTFIYAAEQSNETPRVDYPSPYNTRIETGLPPGPIATPGINALKAVADPASTDYLYFVAGEDGKTYFSRTVEEHESNVQKHCGDLCR